MRYAVIIYTDTTSKAAVSDYMARLHRDKQRERRRQQRRQYFFKQRALGVVVMIFTVLAAWILEGDITIALVTVPLGLALIFSRQKLIVNEYYFETEERRENNGTN